MANSYALTKSTFWHGRMAFGTAVKFKLKHNENDGIVRRIKKRNHGNVHNELDFTKMEKLLADRRVRFLVQKRLSLCFHSSFYLQMLIHSSLWHSLHSTLQHHWNLHEHFSTRCSLTKSYPRPQHIDEQLPTPVVLRLHRRPVVPWISDCGSRSQNVGERW